MWWIILLQLWADIEASFINPRAEKQTKHMEEGKSVLETQFM